MLWTNACQSGSAPPEDCTFGRSKLSGSSLNFALRHGYSQAGPDSFPISVSVLLGHYVSSCSLMYLVIFCRSQKCQMATNITRLGESEALYIKLDHDLAT